MLGDLVTDVIGAIDLLLSGIALCLSDSLRIFTEYEVSHTEYYMHNLGGGSFYCGLVWSII
jgi:hypothetical protein